MRMSSGRKLRLDVDLGIVGEIAGGGIAGEPVAYAAAEQIVHRHAERLSHRVEHRNVDAAERRDEMALRAEMIEPLRMPAATISKSYRLCPRNDGVRSLMYSRITPSGPAASPIPDHAVIGLERDQRAVPAIVDAAGIAVALALGQHVFERGHLDARDLRHESSPVVRQVHWRLQCECSHAAHSGAHALQTWRRRRSRTAASAMSGTLPTRMPWSKIAVSSAAPARSAATPAARAVRIASAAKLIQ